MDQDIAAKLFSNDSMSNTFDQVKRDTIKDIERVKEEMDAINAEHRATRKLRLMGAGLDERTADAISDMEEPLFHVIGNKVYAIDLAKMPAFVRSIYDT